VGAGARVAVRLVRAVEAERRRTMIADLILFVIALLVVAGVLVFAYLGLMKLAEMSGFAWAPNVVYVLMIVLILAVVYFWVKAGMPPLGALK
jgi:hypothetical protein